MTLPAFLFGMVLATLYGSLFHLWRGGGLGRLMLYIALSWIGFWFGHFFGDQIGWTLISVGPLRAGIATLSSLVLLGVGYWLSLVKVEGLGK